MGVDITHIVKHNFRYVEDREASIAFTRATIEKLRNRLCFVETEDDFELTYDEETNETQFRLPICEIEFTLHNGFWQIESFNHYCQLVMHQGNYFWLRREIFDIVKALDQDEAWHAEEFYTWNGGGFEKAETTFEEWMNFSVRKYGKELPEFKESEIIAQGDVHIPNYEPIYHDSFQEYNALFDKLQSQLGEYKLLGLERTATGYLRCEKDGIIHLIDENTLKRLIVKRSTTGFHQTLVSL